MKQTMSEIKLQLERDSVSSNWKVDWYLRQISSYYWCGGYKQLSAGKVISYMSPIISNTPAGGYKDRRSINVFGESS